MDLANNGVRDDMTCADILCMVVMAMTLDNVCWCLMLSRPIIGSKKPHS